MLGEKDAQSIVHKVMAHVEHKEEVEVKQT